MAFLACGEITCAGCKCNEVAKPKLLAQPRPDFRTRHAKTAGGSPAQSSGGPTREPTCGLAPDTLGLPDPLYKPDPVAAAPPPFTPDPRLQPPVSSILSGRNGFDQVPPPASDIKVAYGDPQPAALGYKDPSAGYNNQAALGYNQPADPPPRAADSGNDAHTEALLSVPGQKGPPEVALGFMEAGGAAPHVEVTDETQREAAQDEPEPEEEISYDANKEFMKCAVCGVVVWAIIFAALAFIFIVKVNFEEPVCLEDIDLLRQGKKTPMSCEPCGGGTVILPLGGEWEKSWNKMPIKAILYFLGLGWSFLGVGICCDQFMAAIEEITSTEKLVWLKVAGGSKHKFHVKVWNATVANLTLMALGSSAPEILLSVIELMSDGFFSGELGPSTIVGSAAFNLLVITAVCVSAIPAPETQKIEQTGVFAVTASVSIFAYVWMIIMLQVNTPDMVDVWEAVLTFFMFPGLVIVAFAADRGYIQNICSKKEQPQDDGQLVEEQQRLQVKYGKSISMSNVKMLLEAEGNTEQDTKKPRKSRAEYRAGVMASFAGGSKNKDNSDEVLFGFKDTKHVVLECAGKVELKVVASQQPRCPVSMRYCTQDGQAKAGVRYQHQEGIIHYAPHETEKIIGIPIIDNDTWEAEEDFTIELSNLEFGQAQARKSFLGQARMSLAGGAPPPSPKAGKIRFGLPWTSVRILNDDEPGMLAFAVDEVMTCQGVTSVSIGVSRTNGTTGAIQCHYETQDDSAQSGYDFESVEGTLEFQHGQDRATVVVPILQTQLQQIEKRFRVILNEASPGVKFDPDTDGGETSAICEVILASVGQTSCMDNCAAKCSPSRYRLSYADWKEQFPGAFYCNGDPEEQSGASYTDWFFHGLGLFWKTIFAITPPPRLGGGWPCFFWALLMIGCVTAVVGDMAKMLGCCMGIPDGITAITLVALGTSLPDTLASRTAAQQDDCADNSIGNVTGSNSVNVFLGLGMPWSFGALVWSSRGATDEWQSRIYKGKTYKDQGFVDKYPDGGFLVPAGSLAFSVAVFVACALVCIALLIFRRLRYGGELGGPQMAQTRDMVLLICLWFIYIAASCVNAIMEDE